MNGWVSVSDGAEVALEVPNIDWVKPNLNKPRKSLISG
jgi:hypothetical protein